MPATEERLEPSNDLFPSSCPDNKERGSGVGYRKAAYLALHILSVVFPVDLARWCLALNPKRGVAHLRGQPVLQVQQTCLTYVLDLGTCLADDGGLEPRAGTRIPAKHGEWTGAGAA